MTEIAIHTGVRQVETVIFLLLLFVIVFGTIARRLKTSYPIVLVVAGLLVSFVPGLPAIRLDPDIVFLAILPPLLFHAAWQTSWREFRYNSVSILMLALGLVAFTVAAVSFAGATLFPLLTWPAGMVLGAIVAPTDAIAATSIARRVGLPERVTHVLEGESLVNDASGLLALEFGIALVGSGHTPGLVAGLERFIWLTCVGVTIGVIVGWLVRVAEKYIDDGPIEITISMVTPYAAYFAAEEAHASGVLAVVACGLYFGRHSSEFFSPGVRLQAAPVWKALDFVLNGVVFILIGLQLPAVLKGLSHYSNGMLFSYAAGFSLLVIALRLIWVYPGAHLSYWIRIHLLGQDERLPNVKALFVVGWTGMRGVVSLAAALSLPEVTASGAPFTSRNLIVFLTFSTILVTLVLQGLSLPYLIKTLGLSSKGEADAEEKMARRLMVTAALEHVRGTQSRAADNIELDRLYRETIRHHETRLDILSIQHEDGRVPHYDHHRALSRELLRVERKVALELRDAGKINDVVLRRLEHELDLNEAQIGSI